MELQMKKIIILGSLLLCSLVQAEEQSRQVSSFNSIRSKSAFNLLVEVGKEQSIKINGDEKFLANVKTEVIGDELLITMKQSNSIKVNDIAQVVITVPSLVSFKMEGAGKTTINNLSGPRFDLAYEGAGLIMANGKVKNFKVRMQGVGLADMKDLIAEQVDASVEGVGSVKVYASEKLKASVQGVGSLNYYGNPKSVTKTVGGIGSVSAGD